MKSFKHCGLRRRCGWWHPTYFLILSLAVSLLTWGDHRIKAEVTLEDDSSNGSHASYDDPTPTWFDWTPTLDSVLGQSESRFSSSKAELPIEGKFSLSEFPLKKRSVYGFLGLATKRPHKTAAEIQHLPPQDAFMSVRGKKSPPFPLPVQLPLPYPIQPSYSMVLPGYSDH